MRCIFFLIFISGLAFGQARVPFKQFDEANKKEYFSQEKAIEQSKNNAIEKINLRILLASKYKTQDDLIVALEDKIKLQGESAQLRYLLGGANGIKALQVNKMFSITYVKAMLENFKRALMLDPNHLPALEAYIEALCMVPSLLGGDIEKAEQFAAQLMRLDPVLGYFAKAFIASTENQDQQAELYFTKAFNLLEQQSFCSQNLEEYFANSSMNLPYKMAETSTMYQLSPSIGLCAINHFIERFTLYDNIPLEWAYFQKAQLLFALGEVNAARLAIKTSLEINPVFDVAKKWQRTL